MDMTPIAAGTFAKVLAAATGQELQAGRRWRIETALGPVLRAHGLDTLDQLAFRVGRGEEARLVQDVVEALLNHETSFFRDAAVFRMLATEGVAAIAAGCSVRKRLRIWSAGCSTGQEAYSLAIEISRHAPAAPDWDMTILGTDVSPDAVARARQGLYTQLEIQRGLPISDMLSWFDLEGDHWRVKADLRRGISFAVHNLMAPPSGSGFDIVLCRNVLLYFPIETRRAVLERIAGAMTPDGILVLGAGETVLEQGEAFEPDPVLRGLYRPRGALARQG